MGMMSRRLTQLCTRTLHDFRGTPAWRYRCHHVIIPLDLPAAWSQDKGSDNVLGICDIVVLQSDYSDIVTHPVEGGACAKCKIPGTPNVPTPEAE